MKKKTYLNVLSRKALIGIAALCISGIVPAGAALAQGELEAELVAEQGVTISGRPGETILVPVNIFVTPKGTNISNAVTVTASFNGKPEKTTSFNVNEFNVKKQVLLEYTIPVTNATSVSARVVMSSSDEKSNDHVKDTEGDYVTINVVQTPTDTIAPTITLTNPPSGTYNIGSYPLPERFEFTLDEASEVFVNNAPQGIKLEAGANSLPLPAPTQGLNNVTLYAIDATGNKSQTVSFSYTYDSIVPVVTVIKPLGEAFNEDSLPNSFEFILSEASDVLVNGVPQGNFEIGTYNLPLPTPAQGANTVTVIATDAAGNVSAPASFSYSYDSVAPVVSLIESIGGYFNEISLPKTFSLSLNEESEVFVNGVSKGVYVSGTNVLPLPTPISQGNNKVTISAKDALGNESFPVEISYFYDSINPIVEAVPGILTNQYGWYNQDVIVEFIAKDENGSGISSVSAPITVSEEGKNQLITGTATDKAGNIGTDSIYISIDKTKPTITGEKDREANSYGWYNSDVTVNFTAFDLLSGLVTEPNPVVVLSEEGDNLSASSTAKDKADNTNTATVSSIKIDKTAPTISGSADRSPNAAGWYNNDVTVNFTASDLLSGLVTDSNTIVVLSEEGDNLSASSTAKDRADNSNTATVSGIKIDKTVPVIEGFENGAVVEMNQVVNWTASDALSGLATSSTGTLDTSAIGTHTITATDNAGNTVKKTYTVVYDFGGILQPIKADGTSIFKAGSTIPVKFQLKDNNGAYITEAIASIKYAKWNNTVYGEQVEAVSTSSATIGNQFRYDLNDNQYIFNLSTKGLSTGTYLLVITLDDGTTQFVKIGLK